MPSKQLYSDEKEGDPLMAPTNDPILGSHRATESSGKPMENGWLINSKMFRKSEKLAMRES